MADLILILNLSQEILAQRRVLSLTQLLPIDLPPLLAGMTYSGEVRLTDGDGVAADESGAAAYGVKLVLTAVNAAGATVLLEELDGADFTVISEGAPTPAPVGWSFDLPLDSEAIEALFADVREAKLITMEVYLVTIASGALRPLYLKQAVLNPTSVLPAVE